MNDAKIDTLENYYGIALRQNVGDIDKMISACKVSMFHVAGYYDICLKNQNSWCQYQHDILNGSNFYKDKGGLQLDVRAAILPVHNDLFKRENFSKCLRRRTHNRNESFNRMIRNRVPKNHVGIDIISSGVYDAIAHLNNEVIVYLEILKDMNMEPQSFS